MFRARLQPVLLLLLKLDGSEHRDHSLMFFSAATALKVPTAGSGGVVGVGVEEGVGRGGVPDAVANRRIYALSQRIIVMIPFGRSSESVCAQNQ